MPKEANFRIDASMFAAETCDKIPCNSASGICGWMYDPTTFTEGHEAAGHEKRETTASCAGLRD